MSVYNGQKHLREAIDSILNQTYENFEFIIINDGSTDTSEEIIKSYKDSRIKLINNKKNLGLPASLNKAIKLSRGEYIARMDADDISEIERLEKQVEFMEKNLSVDVCGTWINILGSFKGKWKYPTNDEDIKTRLLFNNVIVHPSVMFRRRSLLKNNLYYDPNFRKIQDYELWARAVGKLRFANINKYLLKYRVRKKRNNIVRDNKTFPLWEKIVLYQLNEMGLNASKDDLNVHMALANENINDLNKKVVVDWLVRLYKANVKTRRYEKGTFIKILIKKYLMSVFNRYFRK